MSISAHAVIEESTLEYELKELEGEMAKFLRAKVGHLMQPGQQIEVVLHVVNIPLARFEHRSIDAEGEYAFSDKHWSEIQKRGASGRSWSERTQNIILAFRARGNPPLTVREVQIATGDDEIGAGTIAGITKGLSNSGLPHYQVKKLGGQGLDTLFRFAHRSAPSQNGTG